VNPLCWAARPAAAKPDKRNTPKDRFFLPTAGESGFFMEIYKERLVIYRKYGKIKKKESRRYLCT
ncbi:MAG: hypothetical protein IJB15_04645, partial [Clostridia bacterium]|nr:hypothetical protein [Clostridia bacterium]